MEKAKMLTLQETAIRLGIGYSTLITAAQHGAFPFILALSPEQTGNTRWTYIIPEEAVERFLSGEHASQIIEEAVEYAKFLVWRARDKARRIEETYG